MSANMPEGLIHDAAEEIEIYNSLKKCQKTVPQVSNNKNTAEFILNDQLQFQSNSLYNMDIVINIQGRVKIHKLDNFTYTNYITSKQSALTKCVQFAYLVFLICVHLF